MKKDRLNLYGEVTTAILYGIFVITLPWERWRGADFRDLMNYERQFDLISFIGLDALTANYTATSYLTNEYAWKLLISVLSVQAFDPITSFKILGFFSAFLSFLLLSKKVNPILSFILLANPISIDLYNSQLRSALAFSIAMLGYHIFLRGDRLKWIGIAAMTIAPFIHTAMVLVSVFLLTARTISSFISISQIIRNYISLLFAAISAIIYVLYSNETLFYLSDRRAESEEAVRSFSFLIFWIILALILTIKRQNDPYHSLFRPYSICIIVFSSISEILMEPAFRFIATSIPIIFSLYSGGESMVNRYLIFLTILYNILQFYYWLR